VVDKSFPYGLAIDEKYVAGTALFLYRLAHPLKELKVIPKQEGWRVRELDQLRSAARMG